MGSKSTNDLLAYRILLIVQMFPYINIIVPVVRCIIMSTEVNRIENAIGCECLMAF